MVFQDNVLSPGPFLLPSHMGRTRTRGPIVFDERATSAAPRLATPSTRTLLYSRIKTGPGGNFVPKFITQSCTGPHEGPARRSPSRCARERLVRFFITKLARFIATTRDAARAALRGPCLLARRAHRATRLSNYAPARTYASHLPPLRGFLRRDLRFHGAAGDPPCPHGVPSLLKILRVSANFLGILRLSMNPLEHLCVFIEVPKILCSSIATEILVEGIHMYIRSSTNLATTLSLRPSMISLFGIRVFEARR